MPLTYTELPKWDVRDNMLRYMKEGKVLYFDEREDGQKVSGTIVGIKKNTEGQLVFAMSTDPDNYKYLGGRGWYTAQGDASTSAPEGSTRGTRLRQLTSELSSAIDRDEPQDVVEALTEAILALSASTN
jgi:hypothetical protein